MGRAKEDPCAPTQGHSKALAAIHNQLIIWLINNVKDYSFLKEVLPLLEEVLPRLPWVRCTSRIVDAIHVAMELER